MVFLDLNKRREGNLLIALQLHNFRSCGWIKAWKLSNINRGTFRQIFVLTVSSSSVLKVLWMETLQLYIETAPYSRELTTASHGHPQLHQFNQTVTPRLEEEQSTVTGSTACRLRRFPWLICWNKMALSELHECRCVHFDARLHHAQLGCSSTVAFL